MKKMTERQAISESYALTQAINAIKRAVRRPGSMPEGSLEDLKEAVFHLSELRYQAMVGIHRNPGGRHRSRFGHRLRRSRRRGRLRGNPILATLGANPPEKTPGPIMARWAKIEYERTDDPEGVNIIREHEFEDGFIAKALPDGSVLIRHPRHALWTKR